MAVIRARASPFGDPTPGNGQSDRYHKTNPRGSGISVPYRYAQTMLIHGPCTTLKKGAALN